MSSCSFDSFRALRGSQTSTTKHTKTTPNTLPSPLWTFVSFVVLRFTILNNKFAMTKKPYEKPAAEAVRLALKHALLLDSLGTKTAEQQSTGLSDEEHAPEDALIPHRRFWEEAPWEY